MIDSLDVFLWGRRIGTLVAQGRGRSDKVCFYFDPEYARTGMDISPLRAPLGSVTVRHGLPVYPDEGKEFGGLPSFIADSMPDHWGNLVFAEWARSRKIRARDLSPLDRLAYIGRRGMGALEFVPPVTGNLETPFRVEISELSEIARKALADAGDLHAVIGPDFMIESLFKVGTSAGGRRPKAVINLNPATGECYSGQVPAPKPGFLPVIIKFDEHTDVPATRIEYAFYLMAIEAGMKMMPSRLIEINGDVHFVTERFDRDGAEKIHVQTLAAMRPAASTYEELFDTALRIGIGAAELKRLFLQVAMNVAGGNVDDHTKNFSFMMDKEGVWHMAPAYDYTFTVDPSGPFYVNRHSMTVNGKNRLISRDDLMQIAAAFGIKGASQMIDRAISAAKNFNVHGAKAGVPRPWVEKIVNEIASRTDLLMK